MADFRFQISVGLRGFDIRDVYFIIITSLNLQKMKFVHLNINLDFIWQVAQFLSEIVFFSDTYVNLPV